MSRPGSPYGLHGGSFNSYKKDSININGKHEETADRSILFCGLILTVLLGHFWILLVTIVVLLVSYINYLTLLHWKICLYKYTILFVFTNSEQQQLSNIGYLLILYKNLKDYHLTSHLEGKKYSNNFQEHDCLRYLKVPHFSSLLRSTRAGNSNRVRNHVLESFSNNFFTLVTRDVNF